jgi:hypothetical protein
MATHQMLQKNFALFMTKISTYTASVMRFGTLNIKAYIMVHQNQIQTIPYKIEKWLL